MTNLNLPSKFFYITAIDGFRVYWIAGPFDFHETALGLLDSVRRYVMQHDLTGRAHFMAWGTSSHPVDERKQTSMGVDPNV